jgi:ABC-type uncharacterized transport system permease subunit
MATEPEQVLQIYHFQRLNKMSYSTWAWGPALGILWVCLGWIRFAKSFWGYTATILSHYPIIE